MGLLALAVGLTVAAGASGARGRSYGTLQLHAIFLGKWTLGACPAGTPNPGMDECWLFTGNGIVPGLGRVTESYATIGPADDADVAHDDPDCAGMTFSPAVITIAGKGEIDASLTKADCNGSPRPTAAGFNVVSGSGIYAHASGSGTIALNTIDISGSTFGGRTIDTWTGSVSDPTLEFDTTPPIINGARPRTIAAPRKTTLLRVTYNVTARDAVDGPRPVTCRPGSGSRFRIGRTRVTCSATDSSANTARATFTVTVRRTLR